MKTYISLLLCLCLILCGCGTTQVETTQETTQETTKYTEETINPIDSFIAEIEQSLNYNNLSIAHSDNVISVSYWMDGLANAVSKAASGDADKAKLWDAFIENEVKQCNLVIEALKNNGFENYSVSWKIQNDIDKTKTLLTITDGEVTYNAAK